MLCISGFSRVKNVVHGIDIDEVYRSGDWDKKDTIKEIIDVYGNLYCRQKYTYPSGTDCVKKCQAKVMLKNQEYLDDLLAKTELNFTTFFSFMKKTIKI